MRRLSKEAKGKRSVGSKDVDPPWGNRRSLAMEMALDDFDAADLDWLSDRRMVKAREDVQARLREIFYPNYEPWVEVRDDLDQSDEDQLDVDYMEGNPLIRDSHGLFPTGPQFRPLQFGESSPSSSKREVGESIMVKGHCEVGSSSCGAMSGGVGSFVHPNDPGEVGKAMEERWQRV